jgi:hypothetical protein
MTSTSQPTKVLIKSMLMTGKTDSPDDDSIGSGSPASVANQNLLEKRQEKIKADRQEKGRERSVMSRVRITIRYCSRVFGISIFISYLAIDLGLSLGL